MFLNLHHTKLEVFRYSKLVVEDCYRVTGQFPESERFGLVQQIRRAAVSTHLNLAEGCSRLSTKERHRFFEVSRSSLIEVDTAIDLSIELKFCNQESLTDVSNNIIKTFRLLNGLIAKCT